MSSACGICWASPAVKHPHFCFISCKMMSCPLLYGTQWCKHPHASRWWSHSAHLLTTVYLSKRIFVNLSPFLQYYLHGQVTYGVYPSGNTMNHMTEIWNLLGTPLFPWYYLSACLPYCKQLQEGTKVIFINCLQNCAKTYLTKFATKEFNLPQWKHLHQSWNCPWWYLFHSTYQFLRYVKLQQCYALKRVMTNMSMIQTTQIQWNRWWAQWQ